VSGRWPLAQHTSHSGAGLAAHGDRPQDRSRGRTTPHLTASLTATPVNLPEQTRTESRQPHRAPIQTRPSADLSEHPLDELKNRWGLPHAGSIPAPGTLFHKGFPVSRAAIGQPRRQQGGPVHAPGMDARAVGGVDGDAHAPIRGLESRGMIQTVDDLRTRLIEAGLGKRADAITAPSGLQPRMGTIGGC